MINDVEDRLNSAQIKSIWRKWHGIEVFVDTYLKNTCRREL